MTTIDLARESGVSLRQLQWWDEKGIISPAQDGRRRAYGAQDVLAVRVLAALRRKGLSLQCAKKIICACMPSFTGGLRPGEKVYLATDGKNVSMAPKAELVMPFIEKSKTSVIVVAVDGNTLTA